MPVWPATIGVQTFLGNPEDERAEKKHYCVLLSKRVESLYAGNLLSCEVFWKHHWKPSGFCSQTVGWLALDLQFSTETLV